MKRRKGLIGLLAVGFGAVLLISCDISTEDLAQQVQDSFLERYEEEEIPVTITKDLELVRKSKTEYTGLMTISSYGQTQEITINVVYDGKKFMWRQE
jgi:hypothetical protein